MVNPTPTPIRIVHSDCPIILNAPPEINIGNNPAGLFIEIVDAARGKCCKAIVPPDVLMNVSLTGIKILAVLEFLAQQEQAKRMQLPTLNGARG